MVALQPTFSQISRPRTLLRDTSPPHLGTGFDRLASLLHIEFCSIWRASRNFNCLGPKKLWGWTNLEKMATTAQILEELASTYEKSGSVDDLVRVGEALMDWGGVKDGKLLFLMRVSDDQFNTGLSTPRPPPTYIGVFASTSTSYTSSFASFRGNCPFCLPKRRDCFYPPFYSLQSPILHLVSSERM